MACRALLWKVLCDAVAGGEAIDLSCFEGKRMRALVAGCFLLLVTACSVTEQAKPSQVTFSGFLGDYSDLTPTDNSNQVLLRYIDPNAPWSSLPAIRLEPVIFWATPDSTVSTGHAANADRLRVSEVRG
jgi:Protein of unknown function (DUF3313)